MAGLSFFFSLFDLSRLSGDALLSELREMLLAEGNAAALKLADRFRSRPILEKREEQETEGN